MTQLIAAIRRVRREVPGAAAVVAQRCSAHDYDDPGKPRIAWDDVAARDALVDALVRDALAVVQAVGEQPPGPGADAVALLALVAGQDVELVHDPDDPGAGPRWRIAQRVAKDRVISVVDPEARHAHKSVSRRQEVTSRRPQVLVAQAVPVHDLHHAVGLPGCPVSRPSLAPSRYLAAKVAANAMNRSGVSRTGADEGTRSDLQE